MSYNSISYCIVPAAPAIATPQRSAARRAPACAAWGAHERRNALRLLRPTPCLAERRGPRGKRGDGQQKIGGVRRIARACRKLRGALRGDEAGIAAFPSLELAREEGAARAVVGQARQMRVDAGDETARAIRAAACGGRGGDLVLLSCSHPVSDPLQCAVGR